MWQIDNYTPYRAAGTIVVDGRGAKAWVVTVRGTFMVDARGNVEVDSEQSDPLLLPRYRGEEGKSSLEYEADVIPEKPFVDILVNGWAFAPGGRPVEEVAIGLRTPCFQKVLLVTGDRVWRRWLTGLIAPSEPAPFVRIPVVYERAYGGFDQRSPDPMKQRMFEPNPVGVGFCIDKSELLGRPVANVEYPGAAPGSRGAAGFGPLCSYWMPRAANAGTYDAKWVRERKPLLPEDFDARFHNCAPEDQQIRGRFSGGERIDVVNMSPEGIFGFTVPRIALGFKTYFSKGIAGGPIEHHRSLLKTVIVEPHERRFIMVWQSTLPCHDRIEDLHETVIREKRII